MPLSALEAHRAWVEEDYADIKLVPEPPQTVAGRFQVAERLKLFERFMISLRNDELETMGPGEPEHGKISYHFNRYLFWEDADTPGLPWFSEHTERPGGEETCTGRLTGPKSISNRVGSRTNFTSFSIRKPRI